MRICDELPGAMCIFVCCLLLSACSVSQVKDAGKHLGAKTFEQVFILAAFGPDALERHNEREQQERHLKTSPYRSSFTRDEVLDMQERMEFERFYEELRARESKYLLTSEQLAELQPIRTDVESHVQVSGAEITPQSDNQ